MLNLRSFVMQYELDLESPFVTMNPKNGVVV